MGRDKGDWMIDQSELKRQNEALRDRLRQQTRQTQQTVTRIRNAVLEVIEANGGLQGVCNFGHPIEQIVGTFLASKNGEIERLQTRASELPIWVERCAALEKEIERLREQSSEAPVSDWRQVFQAWWIQHRDRLTHKPVDYRGIAKQAWLAAACQTQTDAASIYQEWNHPDEDIYTLEDGEPIEGTPEPASADGVHILSPGAMEYECPCCGYRYDEDSVMEHCDKCGRLAHVASCIFGYDDGNFCVRCRRKRTPSSTSGALENKGESNGE